MATKVARPLAMTLAALGVTVTIGGTVYALVSLVSPASGETSPLTTSAAAAPADPVPSASAGADIGPADAEDVTIVDGTATDRLHDGAVGSGDSVTFTLDAPVTPGSFCATWSPAVRHDLSVTLTLTPSAATSSRAAVMIVPSPASCPTDGAARILDLGGAVTAKGLPTRRTVFSASRLTLDARGTGVTIVLGRPAPPAGATGSPAAG